MRGQAISVIVTHRSDDLAPRVPSASDAAVAAKQAEAAKAPSRPRIRMVGAAPPAPVEGHRAGTPMPGQGDAFATESAPALDPQVDADAEQLKAGMTSAEGKHYQCFCF